jgi:hypothetical protein
MCDIHNVTSENFVTAEEYLSEIPELGFRANGTFKNKIIEDGFLKSHSMNKELPRGIRWTSYIEREKLLRIYWLSNLIRHTNYQIGVTCTSYICAYFNVLTCNTLDTFCTKAACVYKHNTKNHIYDKLEMNRTNLHIKDYVIYHLMKYNGYSSSLSHHQLGISDVTEFHYGSSIVRDDGDIYTVVRPKNGITIDLNNVKVNKGKWYNTCVNDVMTPTNPELYFNYDTLKSVQKSTLSYMEQLSDPTGIDHITTVYEDRTFHGKMRTSFNHYVNNCEYPNKKGCVIGSKVGSGKTRTVLTYGIANFEVFFVFIPSSRMLADTWSKEIEKWFPHMMEYMQIINKKTTKMIPNKKIYIIEGNSIVGDYTIVPDAIFIDEADLFKSGTNYINIIADIVKEVRYVYPITATPKQSDAVLKLCFGEFVGAYVNSRCTYENESMSLIDVETIYHPVSISEKEHQHIGNFILQFLRTSMIDYGSVDPSSMKKKIRLFDRLCAGGYVPMKCFMEVFKNNRLSEVVTTDEHAKESFIGSIEDPCPICMEKKDMVQTGCNHLFCNTCITSWRNVTKSCPLCRQVYKGIFLPFKSEIKIEQPKKKKRKKNVNFKKRNIFSYVPSQEEIDDETMGWVNFDGKITKMIEIVTDIPNNEKIIIFQDDAWNIETMEKMLDDNGISYISVGYHKQSKEKRNKNIKTYRNDPNIQVLFIPSRYGSHGVDFQVAQHVVIMHAKDAGLTTQQGGRIMRLGQTKNVKVHIVFYPHSIDAFRVIYCKNKMDLKWSTPSIQHLFAFLMMVLSKYIGEGDILLRRLLYIIEKFFDRYDCDADKVIVRSSHCYSILFKSFTASRYSTFANHGTGDSSWVKDSTIFKKLEKYD